MTLPATYTWELYRGDTSRRQFRLWADAAKTIPADLTGVVAAAEIRSAPPKSDETPIPFTCAITGHVIDVSLSADDSLAVPVSSQWDLQLTYPSGDVRTVVAGSVIVYGDTTGAEVVVPVREVLYA